MQPAHAKVDYRLAGARTRAAQLNYGVGDRIARLQKINVRHFEILRYQKRKLNNRFLDRRKRFRIGLDRALNVLKRLHLFLPFRACIDRFLVFGKIRDRGFQLPVESLINPNGGHAVLFRVHRRTVGAQRVRDFPDVPRFATIKKTACAHVVSAGGGSFGCEDPTFFSALPLGSVSGFRIFAANREGTFLLGLLSASSNEISNCINLNKQGTHPFSKY